MKRIKLISICTMLLLMLPLASSFAEEAPNVTSFELRRSDLTARTQPVNDNNGTPCALVKVNVKASGVTFESSHLKTWSSQGGNEYYVYLAEGAKRMTLKTNEYLKVEVVFADHGFSSLEKGTTYEMFVSVPEIKKETVVEKEKNEKARVKFVISPANAKVEIDGKVWLPNKNGILQLTYPNDQYIDYTVSAPKHYSQSSSSYIMSEKETLIRVSLQKTEKKHIPYRTFLLLEGAASLNPSYSAGLMVGGVSRIGWYLKGRTGFEFQTEDKTAYRDAFPYMNDFFLSGKESKPEFVATVGMPIRLGSLLHLMVGAGYGQRKHLYETMNGEWVMYDNNSYSGVAGDFGLLFLTKRCSFHLGATTIMTNYVEAELGFGITF